MCVKVKESMLSPTSLVPDKRGCGSPGDPLLVTGIRGSGGGIAGLSP